MDPRKKESKGEKTGWKTGKNVFQMFLFFLWWNEGEAEEIVFHLQNKHISHAKKKERKKFKKKICYLRVWGWGMGYEFHTDNKTTEWTEKCACRKYVCVWVCVCKDIIWKA